MTALALARIHSRIARRQRALWLTSLPLTAFATLLAMTSPARPRTGDVEELVFIGQMIAIFTGIAYAAAFPDFFTTPGRLGIDELEVSVPCAPMWLRAARILGTLSVVIAPSTMVLVAVGAIQTGNGHPWSLPATVSVVATIVAPAALISITLSALAGCLLPSALGRIVGLLAWCLLVFSSPLIPVPTVNGTIFTVIGDAIAAGWFGTNPIYPPSGPFAFRATGASSALSLAIQALIVTILFVTGSALANRAHRR